MLHIQKPESRIIKLSRNVLDTFLRISLISIAFVRRISRAAKTITVSFELVTILSNGTKIRSIFSRVKDSEKFSLIGIMSSIINL